jgi:hypothetical protein
MICSFNNKNYMVDLRLLVAGGTPNDYANFTRKTIDGKMSVRTSKMVTTGTLLSDEQIHQVFDAAERQAIRPQDVLYADVVMAISHADIDELAGVIAKTRWLANIKEKVWRGLLVIMEYGPTPPDRVVFILLNAIEANSHGQAVLAHFNLTIRSNDAPYVLLSTMLTQCRKGHSP